MKQTEFEVLQTERETDAELARMAEDVPPMPVDFHAKWMNAVRAEARKTGAGNEPETRGKTVSISSWTRILSIAATFVFLIGGTLLYRNSKQSLANSYDTERKAAQAMTAAEIPEENEAEEAAMDACVMESADTDADAEFIVSADEPMAAAVAAGAAADVSAAGVYDAAPMTEAEGESEAEEPAERISAAKSAAYQAEAVFGAAENTEEINVFSGTESFAEKTETVSFSTAVPTVSVPEPQGTDGKPAEENGFFQQAGVFITDMGDFLLAALPYLAVLAVPAAAALFLRNRKKKTGKPLRRQDK